MVNLLGLDEVGELDDRAPPLPDIKAIPVYLKRSRDELHRDVEIAWWLSYRTARGDAMDERVGPAAKYFGIVVIVGAVALCAAMFAVALPHVFLPGVSYETTMRIVYVMMVLALFEIVSALAIIVMTRASRRH
jgi:hypothetical protein